ncbi:MAG: DUF3320 domain-containing protein [Dehalobacter sp.]|nr:DUF3320 domain-containing protein [Dehalobacter sp.]
MAATEALIAKNLLGKLVLNAWGIARMGARLERRLDKILVVWVRQEECWDGRGYSGWG